MTITVPAARVHPRVAMQQVGYVPFGEGRGNELSFIRRLGSQFYPRFHIYLTPSAAQWRLTLHLDQKQASYQGSHAHSGEYDGELVLAEGQRIRGLFGV